MTGIAAFMESPLVVWVQTFSPGIPVDFQDLCDGVFLNDVLTKIDERASSLELQQQAKDSNARIHNWAVLMGNILGYYQDILQQVVVAKLPNVVNIVKEPTKESSLTDLSQVLLLLLGCAVQCYCKENFINTIKQMDLDLQEAMVEHIKQITDSQENVVSLDIPRDAGTTCHTLSQAVRRVCQERDLYIQNLLLITQEHDYFRSELEGKKGPLTPPPALETYHVAKELTKSRAAIHALEEDLEEKTRQITEYRSNQIALESNINKLKQENLGLNREARQARQYRDELDAWKEKELKTEKYELEIKGYKRRLNELDFYKARVEELREDSTLTTEAHNKLEEQLSVQNRRVETLMKDLMQTQVQLEEVTTCKTKAEARIQNLLDENATLEFQCTSMKENGSSGSLKRFSSYNSSEFLARNGLHQGLPISEELNDSLAVRTSRLEMEKEEVQQDLHETQLRLAEMQRDLEQLRLTHERELAEQESAANRRIAEAERRVVEAQQKVTEIERANIEHVKAVKTEVEQHRGKLVEQSRQAQVSAIEARQHERLRHQQREQEWDGRLRQHQEESATKLRQVRAQLEAKIVKAEKEQSDIKQQLVAKETQIFEHQQRIQLLEQVNRDLSTERHAYKSNLADVQTASQRRISKLQEENASLQTTMGRRIAQLEHQQVQTQDVQMAAVHKPPSPHSLESSPDPKVARVEEEKRSLQEEYESRLSLMQLEHSTLTATSEARIAQLQEEIETLKRSVPSQQSRGPRSVSESHESLPGGLVEPLVPEPSQSAPPSPLLNHPTPFVRNASSRSSLRQVPTHISHARPTPGMMDPRMRHSISTPQALGNPPPSKSKPGGTKLQRIRAIIAPQRRAAEQSAPEYNASEYESDDSLPPVAFVRGSVGRQTIAPARCAGKVPFSRNQRVRASMPERKTMYVTPERRPSSPTGSMSSQCSVQGPTVPLRTSTPLHDGGQPGYRHSAPPDKHSSQNSLASERRFSETNGHNSSHSGRHFSESSGHGSDMSSERDKENHVITNFQVISSESFRSSSKNKDRWKGLVNKMMELQDKNQQLSAENAELRKTLNTLKFDMERLKRTEAKNLELENENSKLKKILDGINGVGNPHDNRIYHYYSFV